MAPTKEVISDLKKIPWYKHGHYRNSYLFSEYIVRGFTLNHFRRAGINAHFTNFLKIGWDHYIDENDRRKLIEAARESATKDNFFLQHYLERYKEDCNRAIEIAKTIAALPMKNCTNQELISSFQQFIDSHVQLGHWLWNLEFVNFFLDEQIRKLLKDRVKNIDAFLLDISYYEKELDFILEQRELLQLALKLQSKNRGKIDEELDQELQQHCLKYAWLNMYIYDGSPFDHNYYVTRLKEYLQQNPAVLLQQLQQEKKNKKQKSEETLMIFKDEPEILSLLNMIQELMYFKSYRIDVYTHTTFMVFPLLEEISSRLGITRLILVNLSEEEIVQGLLNGKINLSDYEQRKKEDVVLKLGENIYRYSGEDAAAIRLIFPEEDFSHLGEVQGTMAYPGKVQGKAKVVQSELQLGKVQKGDVLIAPMTNPNYIPAFGKIVAIVTDEGGILCHSAIVSREMKIPCVMGTKMGTRVFKDGDLVEVDADQGVVRKISKRL